MFGTMVSRILEQCGFKKAKFACRGLARAFDVASRHAAHIGPSPLTTLYHARRPAA